MLYYYLQELRTKLHRSDEQLLTSMDGGNYIKKKTFRSQSYPLSPYLDDANVW